MRSRAFLLTCLLLFSSLTTLPPAVMANNEQATAALYLPETTRSDWICWPDCDGESVDRFDWYKMDLAPYQDVQLFIENTGNFSSVKLLLGIYLEMGGELQSSVEVDDGDTRSYTFSNNASTTRTVWFRVTTDDGFGDDGTDYVLSGLVENDNYWQSATVVPLGSFLDEDIVCLSDCPNELYDPVDWFRVSIPPNTQVGIVAEELSWFSHLDVELFQVTQGEKTSLTYSTHGGSNGGPQDHSVRAWFNTTDDLELLIRVYTDEADDVVYNLSVSQGTWVDITEDDFHWVAFPEVRFGDVVQVQAIRTNTPNDLDVLLFNSAGFEDYRANVVSGESTAPVELMAVEDCLVCSIQFEIGRSNSGILEVQPQRTHDTFSEISWSPTLYLVADYTDYRSNPPGNNDVDVASIFLSVSILESNTFAEDYTVQVEQNGEWVNVTSGQTSTGTISPPQEGWSTNISSSSDVETMAVYRLVATDATTGNITTNSTFEVYNQAPVSCLASSGKLNGEFTEAVSIQFDSSCSTDPDADAISSTWVLDGTVVGQGDSWMWSHPDVGRHAVNLVTQDIYGFSNEISFAFTVEPFPDEASPSLTINIDEQASVINMVNTVEQNTSVLPSWMDVSVIGYDIGVGMYMQTRVVQHTVSEMSYTNTSGSLTLSKTTTEAYTETWMKANLALIFRDQDSGNETVVDVPMPTRHAMYDGQTWVPIGFLDGAGLFDRLYLWTEYALVDNNTHAGSGNHAYNVQISIPAFDLLEYIDTPTTMLPLLALSAAVDMNLFMDIELDIQINTNATQIGYLSETNGVWTMHQGESPHEINSNPAYFRPADKVTSAIEIYGGFGLRLRIAQPGWVTFGLGFLTEDPLFLEGMWNYTLYQGEEPMGSTVAGNVELYEMILLNATQVPIGEPSPDNISTNENGTSDDADDTSEEGESDQMQEPDDIPDAQTFADPSEIAMAMGVAGIGLLSMLVLIAVLIRRK
jgi:hypothetical protein